MNPEVSGLNRDTTLTHLNQAPHEHLWKRASRRIPVGLLPFLFGILVWYILGSLNLRSLRHVLPGLSETWSAVWSDIESGVLYTHGLVTLKEVILGFGIALVATCILAIVLDYWELAHRTLYPTIVFFQALPKVAIAPLLLTWFGFGISSKVATAALIAFFPMLVAALTGLRAVRSDELDLMRSLNATSLQSLRMVKMRRAMPSFFGGLEVGFVLAIIGAVVGELVGAQAGLGYLVLFRSTQLDLPGMFSALLALSILGVVADYAVRFVSHRLVYWGGE